MRFKTVTLGVVLASSALGSAALTMGTARGTAWIGQTLELHIPVQLEAGQADTGLCAEADVFHGDVRVESSRVQAQVEAGSQADVVNVKVVSAAPVDEPVVSVYLHIGCGPRASRKYVLLAEFPPEVQSQSQSNRSNPVQTQVPTLVTAGTTADTTQTNASTQAQGPRASGKLTVPPGSSPARPPKEAVAKKEVAPSAPKPEKPEHAAAPTPAPTGSGKARLRLDPVETLGDRVKSLEAATTQSNVQEEAAKDALKLQQLQGDLKTLLDQAAKNEASLVAMRDRLQKAEADRVPVEVVYVLVALVASCMGALAYLWTRRYRPVRWEEDSADVPHANRSAAPAEPKNGSRGLAQ